MNTERLLKLAAFLETLPPARFDYARWCGSGVIGEFADTSPPTHMFEGCGTNACALGWATAIPEFQALGLRIEKDAAGDPMPYVTLGPEKCGTTEDWSPNSISLRAAAHLFDITREEAAEIFIHGPEGSTPADVADKIREFCA